MITLLHLDDDKHHQAWIQAQLSKQAEDITVRQADSIESASSILSEEMIDCILTDDQMESSSGERLWNHLRSAGNQTPLIMLSEQPSHSDAGKTSALEKDAFTAVIEFGNVQKISHQVHQLVIKYRNAISRLSTSAAGLGESIADSKHHDELISTLTRREYEVLLQLAGGKSNKEIAYELGISYNTVVNHVRNIFSKLRIHSRAEAMHFVLSRNSAGEI